MDLRLKDKVIVVTGGGRGIGESIVRKLAEEGAIPCIIDLNEALANQVCDDLIHRGWECFVAVADLADPGQCGQAIEKIVAAYHTIDGLVNNAGVNDGVGLEKGDHAGFVRSLEVNAVHYFTITRLVQPYLINSRGSIVNICSKAALTGQGHTSGYAVANGMRLEMTTYWANELRSSGVRCNAVVVADSATPDSCLFLLSDRSALTNGEFFHVDGGYVHLDRSV